MIDMSKDAVIPDNEKLKQVAQMGALQVSLTKQIAGMEAVLEGMKKELRDLSEVALPEAMYAIGLREFRLDSGESIKINHEVYAHLSQANKDAGFQWLRDNGFGNLIKERVVLESLHGGTLKAFVKEQLRKGNAIPLQMFGVHEINRSVIG